MIGKDQKGDDLLGLLKQSGISGEKILRLKDRITTTKFRVIGNHAQMLRVDEEVTSDLDKEDEEKFLERLLGLIKKGSLHAIIFQDYNKGILTPQVIRSVITEARLAGIPVVADPKRKNFDLYRQIDLFKPNLKELREGLNLDVDPQDRKALERAAEVLHKQQDIRMVMVTLSEQGIFISDARRGRQREQYRIPGYRRSVADVSGAGDTVVSVAAACLAAGLNAREIAMMANIAGGLVCEEVGVVPIDLKRLQKEILREASPPGN